LIGVDFIDLNKFGFQQFSVGGEIWIKYETINNKKIVKWTVCFTISGKTLLKDNRDNIILLTKDKNEVNLFLTRELRDSKIDDLLS
jgi:hypothetical protein